MSQVHLLISGFVQGVGYREFVRSNANKMRLTGWVRNLPDRRVEVVAQGEEKTLQELIKVCSRGPFLSEIKSVSVDWEGSDENFSNFEMRSAP